MKFLLPKHIVKRPARNIIATILSVIYLMISFYPLASISMHSKSVVHAIFHYFTRKSLGGCQSSFLR